MQLEKMPLHELLRLNQRLDQLVLNAQEKERQALKEKFARMAHDVGFTLEELVGQGECRCCSRTKSLLRLLRSGNHCPKGCLLSSPTRIG